MFDTETKRLAQLVAIQTILQAKQLTTAPELARRFGVSVRTIAGGSGRALRAGARLNKNRQIDG